jgi:hypothetical protein
MLALDLCQARFPICRSTLSEGIVNTQSCVSLSIYLSGYLLVWMGLGRDKLPAGWRSACASIRHIKNYDILHPTLQHLYQSMIRWRRTRHSSN